jgi:hypothetical protein
MIITVKIKTIEEVVNENSEVAEAPRPKTKN